MKKASGYEDNGEKISGGMAAWRTSNISNMAEQRSANDDA